MLVESTFFTGDDTDLCLERVLVHFGTNHVALRKTGRAHPNRSRSHSLALGTRTRTDTHTQDIETETHLHGPWLVWACCDATDVCPVHVLVNRVFSWDWLVLMSLLLLQRSMLDTWTTVAAKGSQLEIHRVLFDTQGIHSCYDKKQHLLGDSVPNCALECHEKNLKPQRPQHILKVELARLGDYTPRLHSD